MPSFHLDLRSLRRFDAHALGELYTMTARHWGRPLSSEEVTRIYREGIRVRVNGGLYRAADLSYALFVTRIGRSHPVTWTLHCVSGIGASHGAVIGRLDRRSLLAAGSIVRGAFGGLASTWIVQDSTRPGLYSLGQFVNDAVLECFDIPKSAGPTARSKTA